MLRVELAKAARRRRTWVMAAAFIALPVLIVTALLLSTDRPEPGEGPPFLTLVEINGVFASLVGITTIQPFFLPLAAGLLAGDSIAGESQGGTLRYLLVRPVARARLVIAKYTSVMLLVCGAVVLVALTGLVVGGVAFGLGPFPTLSGATLPLGAALGRVFAAGLYVTAGMAGLVAIGLLISSLTDSGPGATVATVGIYIVMEILDGLSALRVIHPFLLSHYSFAFSDLFRSPVDFDEITAGLVTYAIYTAVFLGAALFLFEHKDVTT